MIKKYEHFKSKVNEEVGFRKVKQLSKDYSSAEIFFHQDLDGVCSCLAMKNFLERHYDIKVEDVHIIQYGGLEFAVKNTQPENLPVIVDFAHAKVGYHLFDHHDKQAGEETSAGVYAKPSRSNVEIISGEISYSDAFTSTDINLIKTVDSADFLKYNIKPEDIQNSIFSYKREESADKNRFMMGFVVNRLLLSFKNKRISVTSLDGKRHHINKNLLECLVLDSTPSLYSIFNNLRHYINSAVSLEWDASARSHHAPKSLASPEELSKNLMNYIESRKSNSDVQYDSKYKIVKQYGIGSVYKPGSYDRYVVFKNNPEADFVCTIFPMGLIQVSCNPFKEKDLKEINLGEIAKEVLAEFSYQFKNINISISDLKRINESEIEKMRSKYGEDYEGIGFTLNDLKSFYSKSIIYLPNREKGDMKTKATLNLKDSSSPIVQMLEEWMDSTYNEIPNDVRTEMSWLKIPLWDIITESSGGHPSITNIQGLNYMSCRKDLLKILFRTENYTEVMKMVADKFIQNLRSKIDAFKSGKAIDYGRASEVDLKASVIAENFKYYIKEKDTKEVSRDEFIKFGMDLKFDNNNNVGFKMDIEDDKIIGYYNPIKNKKIK